MVSVRLVHNWDQAKIPPMALQLGTCNIVAIVAVIHGIAWELTQSSKRCCLRSKFCNRIIHEIEGEVGKPVEICVFTKISREGTSSGFLP